MLLVTMLFSVSPLVLATEESVQPQIEQGTTLKNELTQAEESIEITDDTLLAEWEYDFLKFNQKIQNSEIADLMIGMNQFCLQKNPGQSQMCQKLIDLLVKTKLAQQNNQETPQPEITLKEVTA